MLPCDKQRIDKYTAALPAISINVHETSRKHYLTKDKVS